jgi:hypothetical protein
MVFFGHTDARLTVVGPDEGIDVDSADVAAQVKAGASPTGRPVVQQIYGAATLDGKDAYLFTIGGYTDGAREWADRADIALFQLDLSGDVRPQNGAARAVYANAEGRLTGWAAVQAELETLVMEDRPASITSTFLTDDGLPGYWGIWHRGDGQIEIVRDLAGSARRTVASVAVGVQILMDSLSEQGVSYWDCQPTLEIDGRSRRFHPRLSYPELR